jgi:hypothetical protein
MKSREKKRSTISPSPISKNKNKNIANWKKSISEKVNNNKEACLLLKTS